VGFDLSYSSNGNTVSYNNITSNGDGIDLYYSSANNVIYHNNFVNNTFSVYPSYAGENVWDNGYPSGGNYWSDYAGVDQKRGPNQNQPGSDGIGDTPYVINSNNRDRYPLTNPWIPSPDLNKNGTVDIFDLVIVAIAYGSTLGEPNWNPNADLNKDNTINIQDLTIIAIHYGETTP
jgi:parallel beta-helix repeat protein